jgi:hypothetical protein
MKNLNTNIKIVFTFNFKIKHNLDFLLHDEFDINFLNNFNFPDFKSQYHYNDFFFL